MPSSTFIGSKNRHHRPPNRRANSALSSAAPTTLNQRPIDESSPPNETDAECWERMLALQKEYHCYNSARLEAAVEALENGCKIEEVPIPPRQCLDLLNESLKAWIDAHREGLIY
ncbi:uncharacterized protein BP5553_01252 [Venustampulla echinocandica]|uniref:Uncharacterized protein n=1 Tax=Venustampulla echinocandica TaxID=2656787 RepID=A0A370U0J3_9HELO|nr:uncharacterized protein BP5553_01252 [Venustampulla echinocandica]RDL41273.1 hypothetical protein BP5553_01252 [Venustampulla echinocandica]